MVEGGPDIKDINMIRLEAAHKICITNKPTNDKLNGWKPLESKPRKDELWQAILVEFTFYFFADV